MKTISLSLMAAMALAAVTAVATAQQLPGTSIRNHDRNAPIDFEAARIEVRDRQNQAIVSGNVKIEQGSLDLAAERVRIFYAQAGGDVQVDRLDADGGVRVTTPAETARAATAIYDVPNSQITMIGNVVLTRGGDVLRGQRLIIDLGSGRSTFDAAVNSATGERGRVSGRFTPTANVP
ncbi:LptA/OstA family protein [Pacificimonas sp. WHA3]|uniref:LptA/OstA family protein n=1 Tax=Pacificimonas pallii TaxID=2827236 RepID=A0ABS6SBH2_9SPHN|nr:LptA/OstA family protein [Pacificimonas pallii]MBV7255709.1 LptA/OstA family protein [Pacificimonas pallii]